MKIKYSEFNLNSSLFQISWVWRGDVQVAMTTDISVSRWDPSIGHGQEIIDDFEYDGGNSSSRLFERSRIKALAGEHYLALSEASDCVARSSKFK